jgi:hypothetical protein
LCDKGKTGEGITEHRGYKEETIEKMQEERRRDKERRKSRAKEYMWRGKPRL